MSSAAQQSLKQLEALVKQAAAALHKAYADNRTLAEKLSRLEAEHRRVKEELHEAKLTLARHERLKTRLMRLSEKLERVG